MKGGSERAETNLNDMTIMANVREKVLPLPAWHEVVETNRTESFPGENGSGGVVEERRDRRGQIE